VLTVLNCPWDACVKVISNYSAYIRCNNATETHAHSLIDKQDPIPRGAVEDQRAETKGFPLGSLCNWCAVGGKDSCRAAMPKTHVLKLNKNFY